MSVDPWIVLLAVAVAGGSAYLLGARRGALRSEREAQAQAVRCIGYEAAAARIPHLEEELERNREELQNMALTRGHLEATLDAERKRSEERALGQKAEEERLQTLFAALSTEALKRSNETFLDLAKAKLEGFALNASHDLGARQEAISQMMKPVKESLTRFEAKMGDLEKGGLQAQAALKEQVVSLLSCQLQLKDETARLASALKSTTIRGRWGEIQLKRIVELAGMVSYCDFFEQSSRTFEEGRLRPDLLVRLPSGRSIVVDAKVPLDAYLEAHATENEEVRRTHLKRHADAIRSHIRHLASKAYAEHFQPTPEFVILFLPGEIFFSAACSEDPQLIEWGVERGVHLASPTTLISMLRAICYGWRQENLAESALKISALGSELYKRLAKMVDHWTRVGRSLTQAVDAYNESCGTLERRVLVTARELEKIDASSSAQIEVPPLIDLNIRPLTAPELL